MFVFFLSNLYVELTLKLLIIVCHTIKEDFRFPKYSGKYDDFYQKINIESI